MADYASYACLLVCLSPCQSAGELIYRTGGVLLRIIMFATTENDPCLARPGLHSAVLCSREDQPSNPAEEALLRSWWHLNYKRGKYGEGCWAHALEMQAKSQRREGKEDGVNREVTIHNLARLSLELNDLLRLSARSFVPLRAVRALISSAPWPPPIC